MLMSSVSQVCHVHRLRNDSLVTVSYGWFIQKQSLKTTAGLDALTPCMIKVCIAGISTFLEPTTTTRATADFARFLHCAALLTFFSA